MTNKSKKAVLFDFDGVIVDTESNYDVFWNGTAEKYNLGIENFAAKIKGNIMTNILNTYFSQYSDSVHEDIRKACSEFEMKMDYKPIPGALEFIQLLKSHDVPIGLVTSSDNKKVAKASEVLGIQGIFDCIVTADRITRGKPDPMCFLLGASDLHKSPEECVVFEDSFAGIQAGLDAGMQVIALSTTNSETSLQKKVNIIIPDFRGIDYLRFISWINPKQ